MLPLCYAAPLVDKSLNLAPKHVQIIFHLTPLKEFFTHPQSRFLVIFFHIPFNIALFFFKILFLWCKKSLPDINMRPRWRHKKDRLGLKKQMLCKRAKAWLTFYNQAKLSESPRDDKFGPYLGPVQAVAGSWSTGSEMSMSRAKWEFHK